MAGGNSILCAQEYKQFMEKWQQLPENERNFISLYFELRQLHEEVRRKQNRLNELEKLLPLSKLLEFKDEYVIFCNVQTKLNHSSSIFILLNFSIN